MAYPGMNSSAFDVAMTAVDGSPGQVKNLHRIGAV